MIKLIKIVRQGMSPIATQEGRSKTRRALACLVCLLPGSLLLHGPLMAQSQPKPSPEARQNVPASNPSDVPAPAASGDSFGIGAGSGSGTGAPGCVCVGASCGGDGGGTFRDAFYRRLLGNALQDEINRKQRFRREFSAEFLVFVTPDGQLSQVELSRSSGSSKRDRKLQAMLEGVRGLDAPPKGVKFPQRIVVRGRRSV